MLLLPCRSGRGGRRLPEPSSLQRNSPRALVAPGVVDGDHWVHVDAMFAKLEGKATGQKRAEVEAGVPAGRFATPNDLVGMAVFLASCEADYIVAQTYNVDGGQWLS